MDKDFELAGLGWQPWFQRQLSLEEWETATPARIVEYHRSVMRVAMPGGESIVALVPGMPKMVVGDWILLDEQHGFRRLLERKSCFTRGAAGIEAELQLIAANVDCAFIICSLNEDFNLNRIERYLALVNEAGAEPVVILSKADLADDANGMAERVRAANPQLAVEALDCRDVASLRRLDSWLARGQTIALLGSSGAGKSTLVNSLAGEARQATAGIRAGDDKGRHTTTRRSIVALDKGALLIDSPGMREIRLALARDGIGSTFAEIETLAGRCRFSDCEHQSEPGCAVRAAVQRGELAERRLASYLKLRREEARNSSRLAERRTLDKALGRYYKRTQRAADEMKGR